MSSTEMLLTGGSTLNVGYSTRLSAYEIRGFGGGCNNVAGTRMPIGVSVLPAGTSACGGFGWAGLELVEDAVSELSCHRIQIFSSLHSPSGLLSCNDDSAMKTSECTPVGMSQMKVSRFIIFCTATATRVPSILPLSLVIMYSETQSFGPLPKENFRVCTAYSSPRHCCSRRGAAEAPG